MGAEVPCGWCLNHHEENGSPEATAPDEALGLFMKTPRRTVPFAFLVSGPYFDALGAVALAQQSTTPGDRNSFFKVRIIASGG